jgi:hypothetical protein
MRDHIGGIFAPDPREEEHAIQVVKPFVLGKCRRVLYSVYFFYISDVI